MTKRLIRTVYIDDAAYRPSSTVPVDVAKRITNPKAWADADASAPTPAGVVPSTERDAPRSTDEPPSTEWTVRELKDFAKAQGIALGEARAKDQILAALAEAGHGAAAEEPAASGADDDADEIPEADSPEDVDGSDES